MQCGPVFGSSLVLRRRMAALLGQYKRRMRDGHQQAGHVRRLHDRLPRNGAEMFRVRKQLRVRLRLQRASVDGLRIDLRRHDEQRFVLRQLHDCVFGRNDLPE